MVRVEHPNGVVVNVPAEKADRMVADGWKRSSVAKADTSKSGKSTASKKQD